MHSWFVSISAGVLSDYVGRPGLLGRKRLFESRRHRCVLHDDRLQPWAGMLSRSSGERMSGCGDLQRRRKRRWNGRWNIRGVHVGL